MTGIWWRLIHFGFRLLYNELAFTYDVVSQVVSLGAWRCWQRSALKYLENQPDALILELAHGTGNLQLDLHERGCRVVGYDLSPYMGRIAYAKLSRAGYRPGLVRGTAQALPYTPDVFSSVICTFPTSFIFEPATLREVYRILQPGGRLIIVSGAVLTGGGMVGRFLEWLYCITGQREASAALIADVFEPYGYDDVRVSLEPCPRSMGQVIVARKPPNQG